jgi:hypothetical protein
VAKHFYRSKYDYRIEWLRFIQTLSAAQLEPDPRENGHSRHRPDHRQPGRGALPAR